MNRNSMTQPQDEDDVPVPVPVPYDFQDAAEFRVWVMKDNWEEVIKKYEEDVYFHKINIKGKGTALHVAISNANEDIVKSLIDAIIRHDVELSSLKLLNERGATPLHLAAYRGFTSMCECIIGKNGERKNLIRVQNAEGETPLFWAVLARHEKTFLYLYKFFPFDISIAINNEGATILHVAIRREMFGTANIIMYLYPMFSSMEDKDGVLPLEDLATRTSAFKSRYKKLSRWKQILYYRVSVWDAKTKIELYEKGLISEDEEDKEKDDQIESIFSSPTARIKAMTSAKKRQMYGDQLLKAFMKDPFDSYMGSGAVPFDDDREYDEEMKEKVESLEDVRRRREGALKNVESELSSKKNGTKERAYLIAAKHGIDEIMHALESNIKNVFHETNSNNENALFLAVKNRQVHVVEGLIKRLPMKIFHSLCQEVDNNGNTILHLAACKTIDNEKIAWRISGAGMHMMWDIKWYKYIERLVPDHFHYRKNKEGETPGEIFKKDHKKLLEESIEWLKSTSESCAIVAALIAGISFATSGSVPGGNQQTGYPTFEGKPAFQVFSICSLIGLYYSFTALIMFLSILTSRKQVEDFYRDLPMKLLLFLGSLFVATVAMFIAFCGGHYFVLTDKYNKSSTAFYFYLAASLPVSFFAMLEFSLYAALAQVVLGKVPPPKY